MTEPVDGEAAPLRVDVDGLPQRVDLPTTEAQRLLAWANVGVGLAYGLLALLLLEPRAVFLGMATGYLLLGVLGVLLVPRAHLVLGPDGLRQVGAVGRGRLTPWSAVAEVRPPDAFHVSSYLRLPGGRFAETSDLPGLPADDARELQRRLEAARRGAEDAGRAQG